MLADSLPHGKSHAVIVDQRGGIIDALSSKKAWIDKDGKDHQPLDAVIALVDSKMQNVVQIVEEMDDYQVTHQLNELRDDML